MKVGAQVTPIILKAYDTMIGAEKPAFVKA